MESINLITDLFKYNTGYLMKHLMPIDKSKLFIRPSIKLNPAIWIFGHIIVSRGSLIELLGGEPSYWELNQYFNSGTRALNDPSEYPPFDEIMVALGKLGKKLNQLIIEGGDVLLNKQVWGNYDTIGKHVLSGYIHESYHIGQITYLLNQIEKSSTMQSRLKSFKRRNNSTGKILLDNLKSVLTVK